MTRTALITGITGQDGSYLAELLLEKGYEVCGLVRRSTSEGRFDRIKHLLGRVKIFTASIESFPAVCQVVGKVRPDECYHLAAQSFVGSSFDDEFSTMLTNATGTHHILAAIRDFAPSWCRFYFAATSEMFGKVRDTPQRETTPFHPRSPYGVSKVFGFDLTRNYREAFGLHASSGILFNHESPRRSPEFVTRKITQAARRIKSGLQKTLQLGNLNARRDWGHARDYVRGMWLMLQQDEPGDYVLATGRTHSVRDLAALAFERVGLQWEDHVQVAESEKRLAEVDLLQGDASLAKSRLGWEPTITFERLIAEMVDAEQDPIDGV